MALILKHQTPEQFVARFRSAFLTAERERAVTMAQFCIVRIQSGDLTDAQFRTAFGYGPPAWATLKSRMQTAITAHNTVRSFIGE